MKIVNREALMKLPAHTLYCEYSPCIVQQPLLKYDTIVHNGKNIDWVMQPINQIASDDSGDHSNKLELMAEYGAEYPLELDYCGRDGLFEDNQLYMVYDEADIILLIDELRLCLQTKEQQK